MQASEFINKKRLPPIPQIDYDKDDGLEEKWPVQLFHNYPRQIRNVEIVGSMGAGKSTIIDRIVRLLGHKDKSQIFWITSLESDGALLDDKVKKLADDYHMQIFNSDWVNNGGLEQLYMELKRKAAQEKQLGRRKTKKKFVKNFVIMDDIEIPNKQQQMLKRLLRNNRHIKTMTISTTQDATM